MQLIVRVLTVTLPDELHERCRTMNKRYESNKHVRFVFQERVREQVMVRMEHKHNPEMKCQHHVFAEKINQSL